MQRNLVKKHFEKTTQRSKKKLDKIALKKVSTPIREKRYTIF